MLTIQIGSMIASLAWPINMYGITETTAHAMFRRISAEDIVAAMLYLLDADAVTGQLLCVDGGQHLGWQTPDIVGRIDQ